MLTFSNFSKQYNGTEVISIPELSLPAGIYWIKGENGSGKTTLFKSMAGLIPFDGSICFSDGIDLSRHPVAFRSRVSYAEAEPLFPGFLTAKDLMQFVGKARKAPIQQQQFYMEKLGLHSFYEKPCEAYSSGMLKKLSLAMALLGEVKVLILDEPLITLDDATRNILTELISDITSKKEMIVLLSSHQPLEFPGREITRQYKLKDRILQPC